MTRAHTLRILAYRRLRLAGATGSHRQWISRPATARPLHMSATQRTKHLDGSGFQGMYDPDEPGKGPLFSKKSLGKPDFYPRDLKRDVDQYVIGQERAKKILSAAFFNHHLTRRLREYYDDEARVENEKRERRARHSARSSRRQPSSSSSSAPPVAAEAEAVPASNEEPYEALEGEDQPRDEFPEMEQESTLAVLDRKIRRDDSSGRTPEEGADSTKGRTEVSKSNILLLGPTGVGKTYILR